MRFAYIFTHNIAASFLYLLFLADYLDSSSTRTSCWLHYIHTFKLTNLSVNAPSLIVFWKYVCSWCDIKSFTVHSTHPLDILPHQIFPSYTPTTCEMVRVLKLVYILYSIRFE